ncbi:MAG TPA: FHA domain-containing protein [Actinomycetota bacterium]|nr:FHA domain-containing protein [Actinomycetota bacterium]
MSPFVLSVLKYSLLALLYFFIYRAVRAVVVDVAGRRPARGAEPRRVVPTKATRGGRPPSSLVVHAPDGDKLGSFRLSEPLTVGRDPGCDVPLEDTYVSQEHARLYRQDGTWYVEDLGSTNGTYLNDRRVAAPSTVHAGDVVRVGKTVLEFRR